MRLPILSLVLILLFSLSGFAGTDLFHQKYQNILDIAVINGKVNYLALVHRKAMLDDTYRMLDQLDAAEMFQPVKTADWINIYNFLVIKEVVQHYPIASVKNLSRFFDREKYRIAGKKYSLNQIEKEVIQKLTENPAIHFVLNCGAESCPPLNKKIFTAEKLEEQFREAAELFLNDPKFNRVDTEKEQVYLSKIFQWYGEDFTKSDVSLLDYINQFRTEKIPANFSRQFLEYDWALNDAGLKPLGALAQKSLQFYTPSTLLGKGQVEVKLFNNLYTQKDFFDSEGDKKSAGNRATYFTLIQNYFYGVNAWLNIGFDLYFKSVRNGDAGSSPWPVLKFGNQNNQSRTAVTAIGPKLKFAPFRNFSGLGELRNVAVQSMLLLPVAKNLETENNVFLDYDATRWWTQLFYDRYLSSTVLLYAELGAFFRFSENGYGTETPLKLIFNYYLNDRITFYLPSEFTPAWSASSVDSWYFQGGLGAKYQFSKSLELEVLSTKFLIGKTSGAGVTYNLGIRFLR